MSPPPATTSAPVAPWAAQVRADALNLPGVYRFLGPRGEPLYVGKSVHLRNRLLSWLRGDDRKATELLRVTHGLEWEYTGSEFEAILREFRLIRELRPRFNVVHRRDRTFAWIRLTGEPAPRLVATLRPGAGTTRRGGRRGEQIFGPFPARRSLPRDLDALAAVLGLRDCAGATPMHFSDQVDLWGATAEPGCARAELGTCPAPCAAGCTEAGYQARVDAAVAFLEGRSDLPLETLTARMLDAAEREAFEFAARCRDRIERLSRLRARITETRSRIEAMTFVYETGARAAETPAGATAETPAGATGAPARGPGETLGVSNRTAPDRAADPAAAPSPAPTVRHHLVRRGQVLLSFDPPAPSVGAADYGAAGHDLANRIRESLRAPAPPLAGLDDEAREELFVVMRWFRTHPGEEDRTTPIPAYLAGLGSRP